MAKAQKPESPPIIKDNFPQLSGNTNLKGQEIIKFITKKEKKMRIHKVSNNIN